MTNEEAIKNINALNAVCSQKDFYDAEFESALALAIGALEKQIPKKPKMRLIDANSILDDFLERYTEMERNGNLVFAACEIKQDFADMISNAPTVDAEPARHGRWECGDYYDIGDVCSVCFWDSQMVQPSYRYCPGCGAKMDEG